jgi:sterol desaturase/sphingolipid hydroxylase (fatty acid hydroxylase superfamily)
VQHLIVYAIPFFFLLIGIEIAVARAKRRRLYRLNDTIADLGCGIIQQLFGLLLGVGVIAAFTLTYERFHIFEIDPHSPVAWILLFLGVDFFYYWFHRLSHEVAFLWAAHVVHHQSEEYNLAVALRQAAFQPAFSWIFYLPLLVLGYSVPMLGAMIAINTLYQFWIHTRLIDRLGPLEWFLNTPSHHRVHHGQNPEYIDRNHGGTLIIWDKLFGTFEPEGAEVEFGITRPLRSWNPLWANFANWRELFQDVREAKGLVEKLMVLVSPPASGDKAPRERYDTRIGKRLRLYVFAQFIPILLGTVLVLGAGARATPAQLAAGSILVVVSLVALGGLLESRRWAWPLEVVRLLAIVGGAAVWA